MGNRRVLTQILTIVGTVLVWLPIVAPVLFSVFHFARARQFALDYLMPAELFPLVLLGGGLLIWAAIRARSQRALIGGGLAAAVVLLTGGQSLAVLTGLASGQAEPAGWPWAIVLGSLILYDAAVIVIGVGGILLLRCFFTVWHLPSQHRTSSV